MLILCIGLVGSVSKLSARDLSEMTIQDVIIRYQGVKTVEESVIRGFMSVKKGQKYSAERIDDDIRSLVEGGVVDDVRYLAKEVSGGLTLIAEVKTQRLLDSVHFQGIEAESAKKLQSVVKLQKGQVLSDRLIIDALRSIKEHYLKLGYSDVDVSHRFAKASSSQYSLTLIHI